MLALLLLLSSNILFAISDSSGDTEIKAKNINSNKEEIHAIDSVIVKTDERVINSNFFDSYRSFPKDINKKFDFSTRKEDSIFSFNQNVKIVNQDGDVMYSNELFHDYKNQFSIFKNAQLFTNEKRYSLLSNRIYVENNEDYYFSDCIFSACLMKDNNLVEQAEKIKESGIRSVDEIAEPSFYPIITKSKYSKVRALYQFSPWSMWAKNAYYNKQEKRIYLHHATFNIFGIPMAYLPKYSFSTDGDDGDTGLLFPIFGGRGRQFSLEFPFYLRLNKNFDITVSRTQYFSVFDQSANNPGYDADAKLILSSSNGIQIRHLISDEYNYNSYYKISGLITDKTFLIGGDGSPIPSSSGGYLTGIRGMFSIDSDIALGKKTFLKIDYRYYSDSNFPFLYQRDFTPYRYNNINFIHFLERGYFEVEMIEFRPVMLYFNTASMIRFMPNINARYDFERDRIGGKFYSTFHSSYISRTGGYNHFGSKFDIGYELPYIFDNGIKILSESLLRSQYHNLSYENISGSGYVPQELSLYNNSPTKLYNLMYIAGNYNGLFSNSSIYYGRYGITGNYGSIDIFQKIEASYPLIIKSFFGDSIFDPKVAIRYNPLIPNLSNSYLIPNDYSFTDKLNDYNIFSLTPLNSFSIYNYGASSVYGYSFIHFFTQDIYFTSSTGQQYNIFNYQNLQYVNNFSGINQHLSTIVGNASFRYKFINLNYTYRASANGYLLESTGFISFTYGKSLISLSYNYMAPESNFFNANLNLISLFSRIYLFNDKISLMGTLSYNIKSDPMPFTTSTTNGITFANFSLAYEGACYIIGLNYSQISIPGTGIGTIQTFGVIFNFKPK